MLPRVLILYTGGTFGMDLRKDPKKGTVALSIPDLSSSLLKKRLYDRVPDLEKVAQCDVEILMNRDSAHIGPKEWLIFAQKITSEWNNYDGIVLLHGTDTMAYTSSALSFLLRPCLKPVVITGAQRPLADLRNDARNNLISAVEIAGRGPRHLVRQVSVFFDQKLFQGNRVRKKSASDFAAFESPNLPELAVVGTTIRYSEIAVPKHDVKPKLEGRFSKKVMMLHVTPSFPARAITKEVLSHLDGVVLVVFTSGTAPTNEAPFLEFLKAAKSQQIPFVITTQTSAQSWAPETQQVQYAAGKELLSEGCFWAGSMTPECAFIKASLILGQAQGLKEFETLWNHDFAGEGI